jgi:hypothetical protein
MLYKNSRKVSGKDRSSAHVSKEVATEAASMEISQFGGDLIFVVRELVVSIRKLAISGTQTLVSEKRRHRAAFFCHPMVSRGLRGKVVRQALLPS